MCAELFNNSSHCVFHFQHGSKWKCAKGFILCHVCIFNIELSDLYDGEFGKGFTSIKTFLSVGLLCEIGITALIISVLGIINVQSLINQPILEDVILPVKDLIILFIPFLICMFVFGLVWNYFCVIANTSVGITVNTIIAGALGIIMLVANTIFLLLPQGYNFGFSDEVIKQFTDLGYTVLQMYQIMINMTTVPLLIINGVSIVICQLKSYWVEKYNDGKQITYIE